MSSHHLQSHSDPNYLIRLQNLRLDDSAAAAVANKRRTNSLTSSSGSNNTHHSVSTAGTSIVAKDGQQIPALPIKTSAMYDRNNIVAASKFANSKSIYHEIQGKFPVASSPNAAYLINNSPTHSLSGSSQHSGSPRTSLVSTGPGTNVAALGYDSRIGPVYENVEYYGQQPQVNDPILYYGHFESSNKKAQPQVPNNGVGLAVGLMQVGGGPGVGRFAHTPQPQDIEPTPIYENLPTATGKLCV